MSPDRLIQGYAYGIIAVGVALAFAIDCYVIWQTWQGLHIRWP